MNTYATALQKPVSAPPLQHAFDQELWARIVATDLEQVYRYFTFKKKWSTRRTTRAITGYHQYLYLSQFFAGLAPTDDVDDVWHRHVLHTEQYGPDCLRMFGKFLHHVPTIINEYGEMVRIGAFNNCSTPPEGHFTPRTNCQSDVATLLKNEAECTVGPCGLGDCNCSGVVATEKTRYKFPQLAFVIFGAKARSKKQQKLADYGEKCSSSMCTGGGMECHAITILPQVNN